MSALPLTPFSPELLEKLESMKVHSGRALVHKVRRSNEPWQVQERFTTTFEPLDQLLDGGLARREMVEVIGRRTCGRFSLALATLAAASQQGEAIALVDMGDNLDPESADKMGIDLERLLWLRPQHLKQALAATEVLLSGGFPLVVFDLGNPPVPGGRGVEAGWLRLARAAQAHEAALLVTSPYRVSGTAAHAVLEMQKRRGRWFGRAFGRPMPAPSPQLLQGLDTAIVLEKSRGRLAGAQTQALLERPIDLALALDPESLAEPLMPTEPVRQRSSFQRVQQVVERFGRNRSNQNRSNQNGPNQNKSDQSFSSTKRTVTPENDPNEPWPIEDPTHYRGQVG